MKSILNWKTTLPTSWKALPLKAIASYCVSSVDKLTKEEEIPVELCNYTDVYKNDFITSDLEFMKASATEEEISKYQLRDADILITKDSESWDDIAIPALVINAKPNLVCGYHLAMIRVDRRKISSEFLFYCFQSKEIRVQLELASTGVTRFGLPKDEIGRLTIPRPSIEVQKRISNFLSSEIAQINSLINYKEQLVALLLEKKSTIIINAVSKGLNPTVRMKSSELGWLREVPIHWEIRKMTTIFDNIGSGTTPNSSNNDYYEDGDINWIVTGDLNDARLQSTSNKITSRALNEISTLKIYPINSLCIALYGATIGKTAILDIEACTNQACCVLYGSKIADVEFMQLWFISKRNEIITLANGGGQPNISQSIIKELRVGLPPLEEQVIILGT